MARNEEDLEEEEEEGEMEIKRPESPTDLILKITKPTVNSNYGDFVSRDMAVGFLPNPSYVNIVVAYISLISDFLFLGLDDMAHTYNADLKAFLNSLRSLDGFERKQETTVTQINKKIDERGKKGGHWVLGGR